MRLFIAYTPPKEIRDHLFEIQNSIDRKLAKINFVAKSRLHVTFKFLGIVSEDKLEKLKEVLSKIKFKKFKIKLNNIGVFQYNDNIKVIWVGLTPEKKILDLQKQIDSEMLNLNFKQDTKFSAHLTLGRVKNVKKKKEFLENLKQIKIKPLGFELTEINLVQSILSKDGPKYKILENYKAEPL